MAVGLTKTYSMQLIKISNKANHKVPTKIKLQPETNGVID